MNALTLDFETYYDHQYGLRRLTIPEYVHDPRFHTHGLAIRHPDGHCVFRPDVPAAISELQAEHGPNLERVTVFVHNGFFDFYILHHRFGLTAKYFVDTMQLAHHVHGKRDKGTGESASLKALAARYGLPAKGELEFMLGVRNPDARQQAELAVYACHDVDLTHQIALRLLPQITRQDVEFRIMMHTARLFIERRIRVDVGAIVELQRQVHEKTTWALQAAGVSAEEVSKNGSFNQHLEQALAHTGRLIPLKPGKNGLIPATAKKDEAMQALVDDHDPVVAALARARTQKKSEDQLDAKFETLARITAATNGLLPPYLVANGAITGRFSGGGGFNLQNLGRDGFGLKMRNLLIPRDGHKFAVGDSSQIEARIVAWLSGQTDLLAKFAGGADVYSEFASGVFHAEVHKPRGGEPPELQTRLKSLRQVGKQAVLGLGFSMGALRFMNTLRADPLVAPLFQSNTLSPIVCREIVGTFRTAYAHIPAFWRALEGAFTNAVNGVPDGVGPLRFEKHDDTVLVWLPSGRALRYPNARLVDEARTIRFLNDLGQEDEFTPNGPSIHYGNNISLYGGKLCENIAQAAARDILVEAILRLEARGRRVLFHVHDEIIVEVSAAESVAAIADLHSELTNTPAWAPGLPLAAEISIVERYGK